MVVRHFSSYYTNKKGALLMSLTKDIFNDSNSAVVKFCFYFEGLTKTCQNCSNSKTKFFKTFQNYTFDFSKDSLPCQTNFQ